MVDVRLFLPREWSTDKARCNKAGIPVSEQTYRSKAELALAMVEEMEGEIEYDWVGGDSIYGNSPELRKGLTQRNHRFIMDVSERQQVYLSPPKPYIPPSNPGRGRKKKAWVSDQKPVMLKVLISKLTEQDWSSYIVRQGTKGPIERLCYVRDVYFWSSKRPNNSEVEKLQVIISRNPDGSQLKYSFTNNIALENQPVLSEKELLYRQMQRYWIERGFQDLKDVLGMTDYQVRGWRAWYHHITLTIMALHYMLEQKIIFRNEIPLLSCQDIKLFFALTLENKGNRSR